MQSAELAARSVNDLIGVTVVDSRSVTLGLGAIVASCAAPGSNRGDAHDEVMRPCARPLPIAPECGVRSTRSTT